MPIVMVVGVIPGALAVRAAPPDPDALVEDELVAGELLLHPAATTAMTAPAASA
jgi:hypothetical protein